MEIRHEGDDAYRVRVTVKDIEGDKFKFVNIQLINAILGVTNDDRVFLELRDHHIVLTKYGRELDLGNYKTTLLQLQALVNHVIRGCDEPRVVIQPWVEFILRVPKGWIKHA